VPDLLLYRKDADPVSGLRDRAAVRERLAQLERVEEFLARWLVAGESGSFSAAFTSFTTTAEFEQQLYDHLRELLERRAGAGTEGAEIRWHQPPFRGLLSFEFDHAPVFFGRTRARNELRELLARQEARGCAFVLVLGASGSGKSRRGATTGSRPRCRRCAVAECCADPGNGVRRPAARAPIEPLQPESDTRTRG